MVGEDSWWELHKNDAFWIFPGSSTLQNNNWMVIYFLFHKPSKKGEQEMMQN